MKQLFTILFVVIIADIIIFTSCIKECSSLSNEIKNVQEIEIEDIYKTAKESSIMLSAIPHAIKYNDELKNRGKELEKLFEKTMFPITREIRYADLIDDTGYENVTATCLYFERDGYHLILHNQKYEIPDNLIIHELCHAALSCANIKSNDHTGEEWDYLCDYFESIGYNPLRDGYSYGIKSFAFE